ncbi:ABC transporter ATP-binding protein [Roseibium sp. SCP14]|uniref:ABC transporter ATP-binding protein n=1 Tax=Roseibium sp. SCP14 TaxID=3141375 RepID=UPI00333DCF42
MTNLHLEGVWKRFGAFEAIRNVNLDLPSGKMITFLGPSGSGKSTLFRLVSGLEQASEGTIRFDGIDVTGLAAHKRNVGMVFQSYALFPHLNVWENIGYGLALRKVPKTQRRARAIELLELIKLPDIADRGITQLSGGQRQRVAIARALAMKPQLFLLDEPLSALDAKLREHMQNELCELQRKLGVTTIVVTHDQREAMTMSDIVVVIDRGAVQQVGSPLDIYRRPATRFVADFIGTSNLLEGTGSPEGKFEFSGGTLKIATPDWLKRDESPAVLCVRPEQLQVMQKADGMPNSLDGQVTLIRDLGAELEVFVRSGDTEFISKEASGVELGFSVGDTVSLQIPETAHLMAA